MADASSGLRRSAFIPVARYRVTGVSGQRASRKGALDGYRVWARDARDVVAGHGRAEPSTPRAVRDRPERRVPRRRSSRSRRPADHAIATWRSRRVVTAPASLLDASRSADRRPGRDRGDRGPAAEGRDRARRRHRIRVTGPVGTAYGAPRLRRPGRSARLGAVSRRRCGSSGPADDRPHLAARDGLRPGRRRAQARRPLAGRDRGRRSGLVVVAQPGARIPVTALVEGGTAEVVGIVRPAIPERERPAADHPAAVARRTSARRIGRIRRVRGATVPRGGRSGPGADPAATAATGAAPSTARPMPTWSISRRSSAASFASAGSSSTSRPTASCSTTARRTGAVVLAGAAAEWIDLIEPGDAINVIGRVDGRPTASSPSSWTIPRRSCWAAPSAAPRSRDHVRAALAGSCRTGESSVRRLGSATARRPAGGRRGLGVSWRSASRRWSRRLRRRHARRLLRRSRRRPSGGDRRSDGRRPHRDRPPDEDLRSARAWPERGPRTAHRAADSCIRTLDASRKRGTILGRVSRQRSSHVSEGEVLPNAETRVE